MGIFVNGGNLSFARAKRSQIYIDKTGLLKYTNAVMDTEQCLICSSRPRRFGKTMTAGMLTAYYSKGCDSRELFQGMEIAETPDYMEYMNQYDVIHLDIADVRSEKASAMDTIEYIQDCVIEELKGYYPDVAIEEGAALPSVLAWINDRTGSGFVMVIDEWDAIFREDPYDTKAQIAYVELLRGLFKGERSRKFMKLAYMTGILPVKKYKGESALNNFDEFTMIGADILAEYVGFTEAEVLQLCKKYQMDFTEMKRWYDGYLFRDDLHIYNPKSVTDALRRKKIANYWTRTAAYESLKDYISMNFAGLKDAVVWMLSGGECSVNMETFENDMTSFKNRDDVLTMLIHLGYLAYDEKAGVVRMPNEEVRAAFANAVQGTSWTPVVQAICQSEHLLELTWNREADAVAKCVDEVHLANTSILEYNNENALSCVITLAYYNAVNEYTLIREFPTGKGYEDSIFLPRRQSDKPAMVVELKYDRSAEGAIRQIKEKRYAKALESYSGNLLLVGINYDKERKKHSCVIEECTK